MLYMLFHVKDKRYAVPAGDVIEVLPLVPFRELPKAPEGVVGVFSYRGRVTPAVDLRLALFGEPSELWLSTRMLMTRLSDDDNSRIAGVIVERATDARDFEPGQLQPSGVSLKDAACLGEMINDDEMIQTVQLPRLFPPAIQDALFNEVASLAG